MTEQITLTIRTGLNGGWYPEKGMPIERPGTYEDYIIDSVEPEYSRGELRIGEAWDDEALPIYSDVVVIRARPAQEGEVKAYWEQRRPKDLVKPRPWWHFWD